jgi:hypothetical protein
MGRQVHRLRDAGQAARAKAAEAKARYWLAKTLVLEAQGRHGKPVGGRSVGE